jgi:hypothetical protein
MIAEKFEPQQAIAVSVRAAQGVPGSSDIGEHNARNFQRLNLNQGYSLAALLAGVAEVNPASHRKVQLISQLRSYKGCGAGACIDNESEWAFPIHHHHHKGFAVSQIEGSGQSGILRGQGRSCNGQQR